MRCQTVRQKLEAYADAEVTPQVRERINGHLRSCSGCREALALQKELEALVRSVSAPPVPDGFAGRLMARVRLVCEVPRPVSRSGWNPFDRLEPQRLRMGLAATAALAAGLLVGIYLGQHTWQPSDQRLGGHTQMMQADPVAASGLGYLTGLGDNSLAEIYLGLASAPNDPGT